jgi:hypothetical protein
MSSSTQESFDYEVVSGVFMQDDPATEWPDFDPVSCLIPTIVGEVQSFADVLSRLNTTLD